MKTSIKLNAEGIETKVSKGDFESYKTQTADAITTAVADVTSETESKIKQSADNITALVNRKYNDAQTQITQTADSIKTKVSNTEFENKMTQIAGAFETLVNNVDEKDAELSSRITQTVDSIETKVKSVVNDTYIKDKLGNTYATTATVQSQINQKANEITTSVSETYETKGNVSKQIAEVVATADDISSRVGNVEGGNFTGGTLFRQTNNMFLFDGTKAVFTGVISLTDNNGEKAFNIFHDESGFNTGSMFVLWGAGEHKNDNILLGGTDSKVYIGSETTNSEVATKGWVNNNASVAKFA